jgi:hypothetical protein
MEKTRKLQELIDERATATRDNKALMVAQAAAHHGSNHTAEMETSTTINTPTNKGGGSSNNNNNNNNKSRGRDPIVPVARDPEILQLIAAIRNDESSNNSSNTSPSKIELAKLKQKMYKQKKRMSPNRRGGSGSPYRVSPTVTKTIGGITVDSDVLSMLSPSVGTTQSKNFQLVTGRSSRNQLPTPHLVAEGSARRSRKSTARTARTVRTARTAQTSRTTGRKSTANNTGKSTGRIITGRSFQKDTPYVSPRIKSPIKKRGGAAAVMDLSELTKGLVNNDSTYKDEYGEKMMPAIQQELKMTYLINSQFWLPKTEQTVINEMVSRARKIQRQIDGLED